MSNATLLPIAKARAAVRLDGVSDLIADLIGELYRARQDAHVSTLRPRLGPKLRELRRTVERLQADLSR